jgi:hypothetical protein
VEEEININKIEEESKHRLLEAHTKGSQTNKAIDYNKTIEPNKAMEPKAIEPKAIEAKAWVA